MRQCLGLVLKVKPFKIFTAIHDYKILFATKIESLSNSQFLSAYTLFWTLTIKQSSQNLDTNNKNIHHKTLKNILKYQKRNEYFNKSPLSKFNIFIT